MELNQGRYPDDLADMIAWVSSSVTSGQRVLEIGCGDGAITRALAARGVNVVGIDPNAAEDEHVRVGAFETLDAEPFDVVFASVSLHHLHDPAAASQALRRLTKVGSIMLVREFDKDLAKDPATLEWIYHQRCAQAIVDPADSNDDHAVLPDTFEEFRDGWVAMMDHHVLPWSSVLDMLIAAGFGTEQQQSSEYLFRWELEEALRPLEASLASSGRIQRVGIRWTGRRTH